MARFTRLSWKTAATHTGNRQGNLSKALSAKDTTPARMAGLNLCSEQRQASTEAGRVDVQRRAGREVHGRTSLYHFIVFAFALGFIGARPALAAVTGQSFPQKIAHPMQMPAEKPPTPDELAAARGMEALLVEQMVQEMRKTVPENDIIPLSSGEKVYRQMLDSEYARIISEHGTLGIADLVLAQIRGRK